MASPLITVVVPSFNQGQFLEDALISIFAQDLPVEVFVMDGGSSDNSIEIIKKFQHRLSGWRSHKDDGQSAAINEGIALGSAPYVCWLNSDDFYYDKGLAQLLKALENSPAIHAVYGKCWTTNSKGKKIIPYLTMPFVPYLFANYCFICQPGTLIRRDAWEKVGGLDANLNMAMDYDLWWKLFKNFGKIEYCKQFIAATRSHEGTKTANNKEEHYNESKAIIMNNYGNLPYKWKLFSMINKLFKGK